MILFCSLTIIPLIYAIHRLTSSYRLDNNGGLANFIADDDTIRALRFTILEASISTLFTLLIGLPIAWYLGRYKWKNIRVIRALISVPFVTPSIVVMVSMLIDPGGLLDSIGIDLRLETGFIGDLANYTGWINLVTSLH